MNELRLKCIRLAKSSRYHTKIGKKPETHTGLAKTRELNLIGLSCINVLTIPKLVTYI